MPTSDPTQLTARTRYRLRRLLRRAYQAVTPTTPPMPLVHAQAQIPADQPVDPKTFTESTVGSGAFGRWMLDANGLPAYRYEMNQYVDERAKYPVSIGGFRHDHWHQVGNERLNALASNEGTVQVYIGDRGGMFLNHFNYGSRVSWLGVIWEVFLILLLALPRCVIRILRPDREPGVLARLKTAISTPSAHRSEDCQHAYAGGFGYVADGQDVWSTAYRYSPDLRPSMERVFGMGYYQTVTRCHAVEVKRRVFAPAGNVAALLADVELRNIGDTPVSLAYYEYWDVNVQQLPFQALRSGIFGEVGDAERRQINRHFKSCIWWDAEAKALRFHLQPPDNAPSPDEANRINWQPPDVFLADLSGTPDMFYVDKESFFGEGGAEHPDGIGQSAPPIEPISNTIMPYCMVLRRDVTIPAGGSVALRFAYGAVEPDESFDCSQLAADGGAPVAMPADWQALFGKQYRIHNDPFGAMVADWKNQLAYFTVGSLPHVQREMAWHAYYLQSSTVNHHYYDTLVVPQGSAYLYLHGFDGAPRDLALFVLPLVYLNPRLAREVIKLMMSLTNGESGQVPYSYTGNGVVTGALVHNYPSDLDLALLLAVMEYLAVTGDTAFLNEDVPFYPGDTQPPDCRVLNHIRVAFDHLMQTVKIGDSGLFRVRDGDWSDDVVLKNVFPCAPLTSPGLTVEHGESVPNSQMGLYVLPRIADLLAGLDMPDAKALGEAMQAQMQTAIPQLEQGLRTVWNGQFFGRAILRYWWNGKRILRQNEFDLEAQVWPLISKFEAEPGTLEPFKETIYTQCDKPSPIGALMRNGAIWPAISQLLTWGYTRCDPDLAWRSFLNHTFANKAEVYGDIWMNIWSGPDGINGPYMTEPGGTYTTPPVTPMTDFPVMNNNQHAMALLGMLRVCGIEPSKTGDGLQIAPQVPDTYVLDLPLVQLEVRPERISGQYRAQNAGKVALWIRLSALPEKVDARVNDQVQPVEVDADGFVRLELPDFQAGDCIAFAVSAH